MTTGQQDKPAKPSRAGRARRWVRRGLGTAVVAVAAGWFVQTVVLPWVIRDKVTEALAGLGFENARLEIRSTSFWQTRLADLTAADGDLRVGTLDISYRPLAAAAGEVDVIRIGGAEIRLTIRDGQTHFGSPAASADAPSANAPSSEAALPFDRIEVVSSALRVDWEGRDLWLPVSGTVENRGDGAAELKLDSFAFGTPVEIAGTIDLRRGSSHVVATAGRLDLATLLASVPEKLGPIPVRAGGRAAVRVTYHDPGNHAATTTVGFEPNDVWLTFDAGGQAVAVDRLSARTRISLDDALGVTAIDGKATIAAIRVADQVVRDVTLAARTEGPAIVFDASARGEAWHVEQLSGTAAGLLGANRESDVQLALLVAGGARLPAQLLDKLNTSGVDASGLGEASIRGEATAAISRTADEPWQWKAGVPRLHVTLPPGNLTGPGGAKLAGLAGVLNLGGTFTTDGGDVSLLDGSWIGFRSLEAGDDGNATHLGETRIALTDGPGRPLATLRFGENGAVVRAALAATNHGPLTLKAAGMDANLGQFILNGKAEIEPGADPSAVFHLGVAGAAVTHAESGLALAGISARIPVSVNATNTPAPGKFQVTSVMRGKKKLEPLRGTLGVSDGRATFTARWAALPDAMLHVNGWLVSGANGPAGEITATLPEFHLDDADALADLIPALDGWAVTGNFAGDAELRITDGRFVPRATLTVTGADARSADAGVDMQGLAGAVTVNSFAPFATPDGQRVTAKRLAFGNVEMSDASLAFRVDPGGALQVERAEAGWLGGRVLTHGLRLDPADPKFETTLYAEGLSLREILAFAAEGRATGEGVMFGKLPVAVDWPRVRLGQGYLRSQSPAGELQVLDSELLASTMERSDPRFLTDPDLVEVKNRVVRALGDFEYDALTFDFDEESGGLVRIHTHGKGRVGERPQELDMTLNVRGANDLLNHYLQAKSTWDELSN